MDLCHLNISQCFNNGTCAMDYSLNRTYCLCDQCHNGEFCEDLDRQNEYDTKYAYLIIYIFALFISVLNNSMCLELFIKCKSIRRTNTGVYLIIYSILCLLASTLLVIDGIVDYNRSIFYEDPQSRDRFHCVVGTASYSSASFLCIWFSAAVQLERGLLLFIGATTNSTRQRSIILSTVLIVMVIGCSTPVVVYNCNWDGTRHLKTLRVFLMAFHIGIPVLIYLVATVLSLIGFVRRIRAYGMEKRSWIGTFLKLFYSHIFIFIPPVVYALCYGIFNLVAKYDDPDNGYYFCGISLAEYIIKVLLRALMGLPFTITWLLFVYPSRVYMTDFYMNTWCGQWTAYIVLLFRKYSCKKTD
ncbi:hypothetical protein I4U23_031191 [Adineta vaga]|nr:hypothetical protein I4U23_031191 [Adineta vaga]